MTGNTRSGASLSTFEQGFADVERAADAAVKAATALAASAKQLVKAAQDGDIAKIRRLSEKLGAAAQAAGQDVANARSAWRLSPEDEQTYLAEHYEEELISAAKAAGLEIRRSEERLVAYPALLRILPSDGAVQINRKKVSTIRPSKLIASLKAEQQKKPRFTAERFIESLYAAYRLVVGKEQMGKPALLGAIYEALTLLPGGTTAYDKSEFGRDIFLLDRSGIVRTKSGAQLSLPASTGTKTTSKTFTFVAPDGELVTYYGVSFSEAS